MSGIDGRFYKASLTFGDRLAYDQSLDGSYVPVRSLRKVGPVLRIGDLAASVFG